MAGNASSMWRSRWRENRQNPGRLHRLRPERIGGRHGEAEKRASGGEPGDLPAPVGQELEQFGGAGGDIEEIFRRVALGDEAVSGGDRHGQGQAASCLRSWSSSAAQMLAWRAPQDPHGSEPSTRESDDCEVSTSSAPAASRLLRRPHLRTHAGTCLNARHVQLRARGDDRGPGTRSWAPRRRCPDRQGLYIPVSQ